MFSEGMLAASAALASWVLYSLGGKEISVALGRYKASAIVLFIGIIPTAIAFYLTGMQIPAAFPLALSAISGIFLAAGFLYLFKSLETEQITNASALGEMQPAILTLFGILVLQEAITAISAISIVMIFAGEILVISTVGFKINRKLLPAVYANICWTIYWLMLSESISVSGLFAAQALVARVVGALSIIPVMLIIGSKKATNGKIPKKSSIAVKLGLAIVIGALLLSLDATGDVFFGLAISLNYEAIGAAITALGPIFVYGISSIVFKDRLTRSQMIGILVMIIGGIVLAIG